MISPVDMHEVDTDAFGVWPNASIEGVRDCILEERMSMIAMDADDRAIGPEVLQQLTIAAQAAIRAGRMIDAGHIPNAVIRSEAKRAKDLVIDGWIGHPFREPYVLFHTWEEGAAPLLVMPHHDGGNSVQIAELLPCTVAGMHSLVLGDVGELVPDRKFPGDPHGLTVRARLSPSKRMLQDKGAPYDQLVRDAACNLGDPVWTVMAMLATDGVVVETIEPPHRLNRQRAAKGKPPIPGRRKVHSAPYITALLNRLKGRPKGEAGAGHHASPVMHLRRGHPRNLADGKRVWVRDAIVNAKDDATLTRSHYTIHHP